MKTHIKICGFTEPIGLQAGVAAGVDSVGLVLDPSPRQLSIADAVRLRAHIPETVAQAGGHVRLLRVQLSLQHQDLALEFRQWSRDDCGASWLRVDWRWCPPGHL